MHWRYLQKKRDYFGTFHFELFVDGVEEKMGTGRGEAGVGANLQVPIAHGGSSSPGLCTSHIDAAGAPCSGQRHPGHQASPEDAGKREYTAIHTQPLV